MSNNNEQGNNNKLKVISAIEIDTKPKDYSEKDGDNLAKPSCMVPECNGEDSV